MIKIKTTVRYNLKATKMALKKNKINKEQNKEN